MKFTFIINLLFSFLFFQTGCDENTASNTNTPELDDDFKKYWYAGKAEISGYSLLQARYGEIREGTAVLVFVTEDFSKSKQVKLDNPTKEGSDAVNILKFNFTKDFNTGINPYSMMLSAFTPVHRTDELPTLKINASVQEWGGQSFVQANWNADGYALKQYSYYEKEGDRDFQLGKIMLEDELWNLIRLSPENLPSGEMQMLPSLFYLRLLHKEVKPYKATLTPGEWEGMRTFKVSYPELDRSLMFIYESEFPYKILLWEETYRDGEKPDSPKLTSRGAHKKTIQTDYRNLNQKIHESWRDSLGISIK